MPNKYKLSQRAWAMLSIYYKSVILNKSMITLVCDRQTNIQTDKQAGRHIYFAARVHSSRNTSQAHLPPELLAWSKFTPSTFFELTNSGRFDLGTSHVEHIRAYDGQTGRQRCRQILLLELTTIRTLLIFALILNAAKYLNLHEIK